MPRKTNPPSIPATDDELGAVFICAVRYCLGRATYMPKLVTDFISPYIPYLQNSTLSVLIRDICNAKSYGMPCDKETWICFLERLVTEAQKRNVFIPDLPIHSKND